MRQTHCIRRRQATNFKPAIRLAAQLGRPLDHFITINFTHLGYDHATASRAFAKLRDNHFAPWYRRCDPGPRPPGKAAFVWVLENTSGHVAAHWLAHIPAHRKAEFAARLARWLAGIANPAADLTHALQIKLAYNVYGARLYMLKGIDPMYARFYGIRPVPQGVIVGKRFGFSDLLRPSACRAAGVYWTQIKRAADQAAARP